MASTTSDAHSQLLSLFRAASLTANSTSTEDPQARKKSSFHEYPITKGPFDPLKYRKHGLLNSATSVPSEQRRCSHPGHSTPQNEARINTRAVLQTNAAGTSLRKSQTSNRSQSENLGNLTHSSISTSRNTPQRRHRPTMPYQADFVDGDPNNSAQAHFESPASAIDTSNETPTDKLKRVQREAMREGIMSSRRRNKHDTAFPEVLAYIRRPLNPQVAQVVEHRVAHYWSIGNSDAMAAASENVEPDWPSQQDQVAIRQNTSFKELRDIQTAGIAPQAPLASQNSRWVTNAKIRAPIRRPDSNAWGSGSGSGSGSVATSQASVRVICEGHGGAKLGPSNGQNTTLGGWDGKMQPPPVDWHDRPRFDNNSVEYQEHFNTWNSEQATALAATGNFNTIDSNLLLDPANHADGLGLISATATIDLRNAVYYGYNASQEMRELIGASVPLTEADVSDRAKIAPSDDLTASKLDETTEILVQRWIGQKGWLKNKLVPSLQKALTQAPPSHYQPPRQANTPKLRISLRPATVSDIPGMTRIYNWYVENSSKTSEYEPIAESDMRGRLDDVRSNKLPFIVAVARNKSRSGSQSSAFRRSQTTLSHVSGHPINNTNPSYQGMTEEEKILGWACASDFVASDAVERTSAECEIYVASDARQYGVGKALVDKLLESCDRGYIRQGKYDWRCAPDVQHLYSSGGGRDLHKLYLVLRKWHRPKKGSLDGGKAKAAKKAEDCDDEWDTWLKEWLECWGFEVEGCLKQAAAKNGRFLDLIYLGRETMWQPEDGKIPDPLPGA